MRHIVWWCAESGNRPGEAEIASHEDDEEADQFAIFSADRGIILIA
jgi:hypothetical protein